MTAPACGSCTAPVPDGYLCQGCTRDLAEQLLTAASIAPDLDDAIAKLLKRGTGGKRGDENPLPLDLAASAAKHELHSELFRWSNAIPPYTESPHYPDGPAVVARWLLANLAALRHHPKAAEAHAGIRDAVHRALAVIDRKPERAPAGRCDGCQRELFAELGAETVTCQCGTITSGLVTRRAERAAAADVLGTPAAIHDALKAIGINIPRGTITSWVSRHRIALRPGNVIALSDVLALHAQSQARVSR